MEREITVDVATIMWFGFIAFKSFEAGNILLAVFFTIWAAHYVNTVMSYAKENRRRKRYGKK